MINYYIITNMYTSNLAKYYRTSTCRCVQTDSLSLKKGIRWKERKVEKREREEKGKKDEIHEEEDGESGRERNHTHPLLHSLEQNPKASGPPTPPAVATHTLGYLSAGSSNRSGDPPSPLTPVFLFFFFLVFLDALLALRLVVSAIIIYRTMLLTTLKVQKLWKSCLLNKQ